MRKSCKVSVVMPCFNHGEFVQEAVESVTRAARDDLELIVVDDGSTDERTGREMDGLSARGIKVIRQENKGLAGARNAGIAASHGEYIFPLDADDRMRANWINQGVQILDSDPRVGVVYGDTEFFGTKTGRWRPGPFDLERLLQQNSIPASALFRRSIWEQNGGYDGTMPVQGFEDWDFWVGAAERGWEFAYVPDVLFEYRKAQESMLTRAYAFEDETMEFVAKKHGQLYREVWLSAMKERESLATERQSVKRTLRNLRRLLTARVKGKFGGSVG